jgi:transmembrane sensor
MDPDQTSQVGDEDAARWFARLRAPGCAAEERHAFHAWLAADPAHPAAYERAMTAALQVADGLESDPELQAMLDAALHDSADAGAERVSLWPRWVPRPLIGGVLAVLCAAGIGSYLRGDAGIAMEQRLVNDTTTRRTERLADGSVVLLDAGAQVTVQLSPEARRLKLIAGRAYFEVAHDAARPFTVAGGDTLTTALGTRFAVDLTNDATRVTLAEGSVAVTSLEAQHAWTRRLVPGQQLESHAHSEPLTRAVEIANTLGWSTGHLHFESVALRDVVAEWNRYARVRITLGDNSLADSRIVGTFEAGGDSNEFVSALSAVLPIRTLSVGAQEILLVRDY